MTIQFAGRDAKLVAADVEEKRAYLRSPNRAIAVRYRSGSFLFIYANKRRRLPTICNNPRRL